MSLIIPKDKDKLVKLIKSAKLVMKILPFNYHINIIGSFYCMDANKKATSWECICSFCTYVDQLFLQLDSMIITDKPPNK